MTCKQIKFFFNQSHYLLKTISKNLTKDQDNYTKRQKKVQPKQDHNFIAVVCANKKKENSNMCLNT